MDFKLLNLKEIKEKLKNNKIILCEGINSCIEAIKNNLVPQLFLTVDKYENINKFDLLRKELYKIQKIEIEKILIVDKDLKIINKISSTKTPYPILGIFNFPDLINIIDDSNFLNQNNEKQNKNIKFAFENIQDPGNLGTIIRTLVSFNFFDIILIGKDTTSIFSPKVIRSSSGNIFYLKNIFLFKNDDNFLIFLKKFNYELISLSIEGESILSINNKINFFDQINSNENLNKIVFIFGNEGKGISEKILKHSYKKLKIPLNNKIDSLNVSISFSIIAWEIFKILNNY
ncbi:MAG: RNA methyltransferase [Spirochaetes bacterium]|nr:RNA methyltransferase [Spirochaetota bacterium]